MKRKLLITSLVLVTLLWAFELQAQGPRGRGGKAMAQGCWNCPAGVNLTQDQITGLNSLRQSFWKDTESLKSKIYQKRLQKSTLLLEPAPDTEKVKKVQKEISDLKSQLDEKRLAYQLEARKLLTPEQIAQLPPGCGLGFGNMRGGRGCGYGTGFGMRGGCGHGFGMGGGYCRGWY